MKRLEVNTSVIRELWNLDRNEDYMSYTLWSANIHGLSRELDIELKNAIKVLLPQTNS